MKTSAARQAGELDAGLAELLARSALGDRAAFRGLYDATAARLLGVIVQLVGRGAVAEDLLQDVYVRIWRSAAQYRAGAGTPMAWMAAAARYRAIDHLRARAVRPELAIGDLPARAGHDDADDGVEPQRQGAGTLGLVDVAGTDGPGHQGSAADIERLKEDETDENRLGCDADGGQRVGAQVPDHDHVDHAQERHHHQFQHHRPGQVDDRAPHFLFAGQGLVRLRRGRGGTVDRQLLRHRGFR